MPVLEDIAERPLRIDAKQAQPRSGVTRVRTTR